MKKDNVKVMYSFESGGKKYVFLKPTRKQKEDNHIFYLKTVNFLTSQGIKPRAVWNKQMDDFGGTISDSAAETYKDSVLKMHTLQQEKEDLLKSPEKNSVRIAEISDEQEELKNRITPIHTAQISAYENTAESQASNKALTWWVTELCYEDNGSEYVNVFGDGSFDSKLDKYDDLLEEGDDETQSVLTRFLSLVVAWRVSGFSKQEEFASIESEKEFLTPKEEVTVEKIEVEAKE